MVSGRIERGREMSGKTKKKINKTNQEMQCSMSVFYPGYFN